MQETGNRKRQKDFLATKNKRRCNLNVIKLINDDFEGNAKNVLLFFLENLNFFIDIQVKICGLLSFLIIGQLFIGICFGGTYEQL